MGSQVDAVFPDFRKALDTVPHSPLMNKVRAYGISDQLRDRIGEFLDNRSYHVILNGEKCSEDVDVDEARVMSGVPQESALGPLLFTIYINDLVDNIGSLLRLFADDAVVYREIVTMENCIEMLGICIELTHGAGAWPVVAVNLASPSTCTPCCHFTVLTSSVSSPLNEGSTVHSLTLGPHESVVLQASGERGGSSALGVSTLLCAVLLAFVLAAGHC